VIAADLGRFVMRTTRSLISNLRLLGLVLCGLVLSACSQEPEVITGPILIRDGITYHQYTNEPVTGIVETFWDNGQLWVRGNYIDGKQDGLHENYYENGQLWSRGNYVDGKRDGLSEEFYENGQLRSRGNYVNGERDGLWDGFDREGRETYAGEYIYGEMFDDIEVVKNENGQLESKIYNRDGEEVVQTRLTYHDNGQLRFRGNYKDMKGHGLVENFYENGQLSARGYYVNGERDGLWESFYLNGQAMSKQKSQEGKLLFSEHFDKKNQLITNGILVDHYNNGQLRIRGVIKDGKQDGLSEGFYENGQLSSRETFKDGEPNGLVEFFDENGQLSLRGNLIDGKREGLWEWFYENGQLRFRGNFIDDLQDGLWEYFDEDGVLPGSSTYRNGELVEENDNP
jgi:antitoxin component YwqK of YwqJK toxin-antitoxin module